MLRKLRLKGKDGFFIKERVNILSLSKNRYRKIFSFGRSYAEGYV